MSGWPSASVAARKAVNAPTHAIRTSTSGAATKSG